MNKKITTIIFLFFGISSCFVASFLSKSKSIDDFENQAAKLEQVLLEEFTSMNKELEGFIKTEKNNPLNLYEKYNEQYFIRNGLAFYITNNDSLIYWSVNSIPFEYYSFNFQKDTVLQLKNGWYYLAKKVYGDNTYITASILKYNYKYSNKYLQNNWIVTKNKRGSNLEINTTNGFPIDYNGKNLFYLRHSKKISVSNLRLTIVFSFHFIGIVLLLLSLNAARNLIKRKTFRNLIDLCSILLLVLFRYWMFESRFPSFIYSTKLFSPYYYANSDWLPSLGDLLLNVLLLLYIIIVIFKKFNRFKIRTKDESIRFLLATLSLILIFTFSAIVIDSFEGLILNSNIAFNIHNIFTLNGISYLGFFIISLILLCFVLFSYKTLSLIDIKRTSLLSLIIALIVSVIVYVFLDILYFREKLQLFIPFAIAIGTIVFRIKYYRRPFNFAILVLIIVFFSVFSTLALNYFKDYKEKEYRKILAIDLATEKDPIGESIFLDIEKAIKEDRHLKEILSLYPDFQDDAIKKVASHFKGYWSKYDILITLCNSAENLIIKPSYQESNCFEFFNEMISDIGQHTLSSSLYYLENNSGKNSYLAIFELKSDTLELPKIFIELNSKFTPKDLGYPELLIDKRTLRRDNLNNYSYAKYKNKELFTNYGKYFYNINLTRSSADSLEYFFYDLNGYNHLLYKSGEESRVIISKQRESFLDIISPFSYLFLIYSIICFLFIAIVIKPKGFFRIQPNLKSRIQFAITIIVIISFFIIGSGSITYIYNIYNKKNTSLITEKMHSLLIELEHKLANQEELTFEMEEYLTDLLIKFQNVFFTDINLYNLNGDLLASSRPKIFSEGLISTKMNASAYNELRKNKQFFYFHEERIGSMKYMSVYVPFRNDRNKHIAYLNLPYFAKQDELQDEISSFLVTFVNVYLLLISLAIIIAIIISAYITKPLQLIKEKLSKIIYGKQNEKIEWNKKDELGSLIVEYNRMVDELVQSAALLAQSERESAWREMAKQVAHEIKNPLTPMKLNVQYLQRAWKNKEPDWDQRLQRFSESIIEQIDTLSKIASEFSNFAKMPRTANQKIDLMPLLKTATDLFIENSHLSISLVANISAKAYLFADKEQLLRVFNNLIKNAIQAKKEGVKCLINISVTQEEQFYKISVEDNGKGIPDELKDKIFSPNFTTKSSGMGLGLAMVHNIISSAGGRIEFESQKDIGTTFNIWLPKYLE